MILKDITKFLKVKLPNLYVEHQEEINVEQFGVLELDLISVDENCEQWIATLYLYTDKRLIRIHHEKIKELMDYCRINGCVKYDNTAVNIYTPQVNIVGKTEKHYVHSLAIPINLYKGDVI